MTLTIIQMNQLEKIYRLANKEEIVSFLARYPELMESLLEAEKPIRKHFGEVPLELLFDADEEYPDWQTLFITIDHHDTLEDANRKKRALLNEWLTHLPKTQKSLLHLSTIKL